MKCHYLPQFLLRGFTQGYGLHEFNMLTGVSGRKAVDESGQIIDFYFDDLEHGYLQEIDGKVATIFQKNFDNADHAKSDGTFELDPESRRTMAAWLSLFITRTPAAYKRTVQAMEMMRSDPVKMNRLLRSNPTMGIVAFSKANPAAYAQLVAERGEEAAHAYIVDFWIAKNEANPVPRRLDPKKVFNYGIDGDYAKLIGDALMKMKWNLLQSEDPLFIGDFPLCIWKDGQPVGINSFTSNEVQITFPISRRLCLLMHQPSAAETYEAILASLDAGELNYRQMETSVEHIYGSHDLTQIVKMMHEEGHASGKFPIQWNPSKGGWSARR